MIFFAALAAALTTAPASPSVPTVCPAMLTAQAQSCRAVEADKAGRFAESAAAFESAADLTPATDAARDRALAAAGNMWIAAGQPAKAAIALDKALAGTGLQAEQRGLALLDRARAAEAQADLKTARAKVGEAARTIAADPYLWFFSAALAVREDDIPTARIAIARALRLAPDSPEVMFEAGHVAKAAGQDAQAREYWTSTAAADPNGAAGRAARRALAVAGAPLTVTNQVAARPDGDGEGQDKPQE